MSRLFFKSAQITYFFGLTGIRFFNTHTLLSNLTVSTYFRVLIFHSFNMPKESMSETNKLYKRLKEVNKQALALQSEIASIMEEVRGFRMKNKCEPALISSESDSEGDDSDATIDLRDGAEPSAKRSKYDYSIDDEHVVVYTDGACENNGYSNAKAGIGAWFGDNHPLNISEPVKGRATNNTAEIQACIRALKVAREQGLDKVKIITDSQFTINCITKWIFKWKKNNWRLAGGGGEVKNKTDLIELDKIRSTFESIRWEHVPGHRGVKGNEEADRLARDGASRYRP